MCQGSTHTLIGRGEAGLAAVLTLISGVVGEACGETASPLCTSLRGSLLPLVPPEGLPGAVGEERDTGMNSWRFG